MQMLWVGGNHIEIGTYLMGRTELIKHLNNLGRNTRSVVNREAKKRDFRLSGKIIYLPRTRLKMFRNSKKWTSGSD